MKRSYVCIIIIGLLTLVALKWPWKLSILDKPYSIVLEDQEGKLLSAQIAADDQWRFPLSQELPKTFVKCITTYEDKRFFWHLGIDPFAVIRAISQNNQAGKVVSGASTLTMQLVRMSRGNPPRTFTNKLIESFLALNLECRYSKKEILSMYAAHAPFGGNIIGLETASWRLFNKHPSQLSWAEMATLCVLPNAPSLVRIDKNRTRLLEKRNHLINILHNRGIISNVDWELALEEPLEPGLYALPSQAPHLLEWYKNQGSTGRVQTRIDGSLQDQYKYLLNRNYENFKQNGIHNAALILLDNRTGQIVAYQGNVNRSSEETDVDIVQAERSSGSILKPLLYATTLDDGLITPKAWLLDIPIYIDGFSPSNYNHNFSGAVAADVALSRSLNIPFVVLLKRFGVEKFRKIMNSMGLSTIDRYGDYYGLSLILGGAEVSLYELSKLYARMANKLCRETHLYSSNWDDMNEKLAISSESIYFTFDAMQKLARPNGHGDWDRFYSSRQIAWKTGTSYGHRDAWAIGVTPDYTLGVWVGNADGEGRDQIIGISTAGKILFEAFDALPDNTSWFELPQSNTIYTEICAQTGMLPSSQCADRDTCWLPEQSMLSDPCPYHISLWVDETKEWRVNRDCYSIESMCKRSFIDLPPTAAQYYFKNNTSIKKIPPKHPDCFAGSSYTLPMEWKYPNKGERIFLPRDFNDEKQQIIAEVIHQNLESSIFWYLNDVYIGTTRHFHQMNLDILQRKNRLYCIDDQGNEISQNFYAISESETNITNYRGQLSGHSPKD